MSLNFSQWLRVKLLVSQILEVKQQLAALLLEWVTQYDFLNLWYIATVKETQVLSDKTKVISICSTSI